MGLSVILELILGALKFPDAVLAVIRALKATPVQQQQALITSIQAEAANYAKTGRPTWS